MFFYSSIKAQIILHALCLGALSPPSPNVLNLPSPALKVAISSDASILAAACQDEKLYVYSGDPFTLTQIQEKTGLAKDLAISSNGSLIIITWSTNFTLYSFTGSSLKPVTSFANFNYRACDFNEANNCFYIGQNDGTLRQISADGLDTTQYFYESSSRIIDIEVSVDGTRMATAAADNKIRIYKRTSNFSITQTININRIISRVHFSSDMMYLFVAQEDQANIQIYQDNSTHYEQIREQSTGLDDISEMAGSANDEFLAVADNSTSTVKMYTFNQTFKELEHLYNLTNFTGNINALAMSQHNDHMIVSTSDGKLYVYPGISTENVTDNNNSNTKDIKQPLLPKNCRKFKGKICVSYCAEECSTCYPNGTCIECRKNYLKNHAGECQVQSLFLQIFTQTYSILSVFKVRKVKFLFLAVDNFWLYEYHNRKYTYLTGELFDGIRLIESKRNEIIDPDNFPFVKESVQPTYQNYIAYSNPKYACVEEGKDSFFFRSTIEYFFLDVPYCLIVFFLLNRLFYCLFNYQISQYLRIFSFWGFLYQMLIEGNIQYFSFLAFRNFQTMFSFDFSDKVYLVLFVLFFFFVVAGSIGSFFLLYYSYQKLVKYFLVNTYRIKGALFIMTYIYGIRPFIKGLIHAYLYNYNSIQLASLASIEFFTFLLLIYTELMYEVFIYKILFFFECAFYLSLAVFNVFLLISTSIEDHGKIDNYLKALLIIISCTTVARVILDILLCRKIVESDFEEQMKKHKNFTVVVVETDVELVKKKLNQKNQYRNSVRSSKSSRNNSLVPPNTRQLIPVESITSNQSRSANFLEVPTNKSHYRNSNQSQLGPQLLFQRSSKKRNQSKKRSSKKHRSQELKTKIQL